MENSFLGVKIFTMLFFPSCPKIQIYSQAEMELLLAGEFIVVIRAISKFICIILGNLYHIFCNFTFVELGSPSKKLCVPKINPFKVTCITKIHVRHLKRWILFLLRS